MVRHKLLGIEKLDNYFILKFGRGKNLCAIAFINHVKNNLNYLEIKVSWETMDWSITSKDN
jgi:hypothetical protein